MTRSRLNTKSPEGVLAALRNVPSPLTSDEQCRLFEDAAISLQRLLTNKRLRKIADSASKELVRVIDATVRTPRGERFDSGILFGLKVLGYLGTTEGAKCTVRCARAKYASDSFMWSMALSAFGEGHPCASWFFGALGRMLPEGFLGVCLLDAANVACREHNLKKHPFDTREGVKTLASFIKDSNEREATYAVSACAALPFISPTRRKSVISIARKSQDPSIQLEVAWAMAQMGEKDGLDFLARQCLDRNTSRQAITYLAEIGRKKLIPRAAREPDFAAIAEMCDWLRHPNEFGRPPDHIEMVDKRTIYWPPTRDTREVRLFSFVYEKRARDQQRVRGVGMVGSVTWSFIEGTKPSMKAEEIYGHHCCFELEANGDPRTPKKRSGKAGWALVQGRV